MNKLSVVEKLHSKGLIKPPPFVVGGTVYETIMGSVAYGVSNDTSDMDVYGFCMPPKDLVFPHLRGEIPGFGQQIQRFEQFQQHHIFDKDSSKEYDLGIYSIVKYFQLCLENNPNMIDSLFTPERAVLTCTSIGQLVRTNRKKFLHKGSYFKFKGYAFSQLKKMKLKTAVGKRKEGVEKYGYDLKFAYHLVRLLDEAEQILMDHDLDLQRNREQLKSIRRGEWELKQIEEYFFTKEKQLENAYNVSKLRHKPDEKAIKTLLLSCLEEYYGNLEKCLVDLDGPTEFVRKVKQLVDDNSHLLLK